VDEISRRARQVNCSEDRADRRVGETKPIASRNIESLSEFAARELSATRERSFSMLARAE
jgi:hypothetical protein